LPVWKILCIDSLPSASDMTKLLLEKLFFLERGVRVLETSSIDKAEKILEKTGDIAVILIDIEEDQTKGLMFIHDVRRKYRNHRVRIILRTGYPYALPNKQDIQDYMIDGYIPKEIISETQIEITVMTAIRAYHQIISTETMLSSLAGSIAHEMRNPLAQIHGNLYLLQEQVPYLNDKAAEHINSAQKVIQSGLQVIDMTMDAIRERPIDPDSFKLLSAQALVKETVADYAYEESAQSQKVSVKGEDFKLIAEPVTVKYVLYNLIKNALFYVKTLPDTEISISLTPSQDDSLNCIEVRDTGPGIAPDAIPKLFDSFYTFGKQGTGLGLSYCKRTMTALGGDIYCHSELSQYTAFTLSFPLAEQTEQVSNADRLPRLTKYPSLMGKTVLVVEDERMSRRLVKAVLEKQGVHCLEAANGQEALDLLSAYSCDLIVTDMQMPIMNGLELIKVVRGRERTAGDTQIPIVILSAEKGDMVDAAMQLGVNDYFIKSASVEGLVPKLQRLLVG